MIRLTGCFVAFLFILCKPLGAQLNETYARTTNLYIVLVKFRDSEPHGWSGDPPSPTSDAYKTQDFERLFGAAGPSQGFGPTEDVFNILGQRLATLVEEEQSLSHRMHLPMVGR